MTKSNSPLYQSGIQAAIANVASTNTQSAGSTPSYGGGGSLIGGIGSVIDANPQIVGSTVGANQPANIPVPIDGNTQINPTIPGNLDTAPPVVTPLPPAPNLAPINPRAVSAPEAVAGVFGENTEGQYGRQNWNAQ